MSLERWLGPSQTRPPLPPYWPLYALRFRQMARLVCRVVLGQLILLNPPGREELRAYKLVIYANHPSFWDPLVLALLIGRYWPGHAVLSPIDEESLRRHWYFRGLGFFGIQKSSVRGIRQFLFNANAALNSKEPSVLALTPEGKYSSPLSEPIKLQRGLARALKAQGSSPVAVIPVAIDYRSPGPATMMLGSPITWDGAGSSMGLGDIHADLTYRLQSALDELRDVDLSTIPGAVDLLRSR